MRLVKTYAVSPVEDTPRDVNEDHHEQRRIWQAVESLPQRQRDITELVFCRDMTIEAASAVMGVSIGTGRVHYDRAKKALAGALAGLQSEGSSK
jgi:RNA polymerase sigma factor (sigma-70 family)